MSSTSFNISATQYVPFEKRWDADGKVYMQVQCHGALTKLTPYGIVANEFGWITQALPAAGKYIYVGVPDRFSISTADVTALVYPWLQIGGYLANVITPALDISVGHGLTINTGAVADIGADFTGAAGEFAVATVAGGSVEVQTLMLIPERIITI